MAELVDWLHHESITRAATNTASSYVRQDHHLPHGSLEPHITNADRIRQMTDEELAEIISSLGNCDTCYLYLNRGCNINTSCKDAVLGWLRKEVEE